MDLFTKVSPHNEGWRAVKKELIELRDRRIEQLIGEMNPDESNKLRGAIQLVNMLLKAEEAALKQAAYRG